MNRRIQILLCCWSVSHIGHGALSFFYEKASTSMMVPAIYAAFTVLMVGAWKRNRRAARLSAVVAIMTIVIQAVFVWNRDAYGSLSTPVLVFDVMGIACSLLYLAFYFSTNRERYLSESPKG